MADLNDRILQEAAERGDSLLVDDFVRLVEQYHAHDRPGVARDTLDAYVRGVAEERPDFDAEGFLGAVDGRLTDGEEYTTDAFYRLDGDRVSAYPQNWHDELGGETDLREYVRFLSDPETADQQGAELGGSGPGVPENELLDVVGIVGGTDPNTAKAELEDRRDDGELVEDADQHPNARVRLAERADNTRDSSLQS